MTDEKIDLIFVQDTLEAAEFAEDEAVIAACKRILADPVHYDPADYNLVVVFAEDDTQ